MAYSSNWGKFNYLHFIYLHVSLFEYHIDEWYPVKSDLKSDSLFKSLFTGYNSSNFMKKYSKNTHYVTETIFRPKIQNFYINKQIVLCMHTETFVLNSKPN